MAYIIHALYGWIGVLPPCCQGNPGGLGKG